MAATLDHIHPPRYQPLMPSETPSPKSARSFASSSQLRVQSTGCSIYKSSTNTDEGTEFGEHEENLPSYTPALTMKGLLQMKPELSSPYRKASHRNWRTAILELNNTQLRITQSTVCDLYLFRRTTTYSLQFAEIGLASDYDKRPCCFRLRLEEKQMVFDGKNRQEMLSWMVGLQMAISLALPLELRQMPEEVKCRRHRRRARDRTRIQAQGEVHRAQRRSHIAQISSPGNPQDTSGPPAYRESRLLKGAVHRNSNRRRSGNSTQVQGASDEAGKSDPTQPENKIESGMTKWHPQRRGSRFSEKDFPHLFKDTSWEGRTILYQGQWAKVRNRRIILLLTGSSASAH